MKKILLASLLSLGIFTTNLFALDVVNINNEVLIPIEHVDQNFVIQPKYKGKIVKVGNKDKAPIYQYKIYY